MDKQLKAFLNLKRLPGSDYDALVAYSGGKDSSIALYLAKRVLNLNVIAYTLDNGFIPDEVLKRSKSICDFLEVPLVVVKDDIYNNFLENYELDSTSNKWFAKKKKDLCSDCSNKIFSNLRSLLDKYKIQRVITGLNTYHDLSEFSVRSVKKYWYQSIDSSKSFYWHIALPYTMQINMEMQNDILQKINWSDINLKGYTSNCLIPGFTEGLCQTKSKYNLDIVYLAKEKRSGYFKNNDESFLQLLKPKIMTDTDHETITSFFMEKGLI